MQKKTPLKKYYLLQLLIAFLLPIVMLSLISFFTVSDSTAATRLMLMSVIIAVFNVALNALVNALNYTFKKSRNQWLAFYTPIVFWSIVLLLSFKNNFEARSVSLQSHFMTLLWAEAIVYNLIVRSVLLKWVALENKSDE